MTLKTLPKLDNGIMGDSQHQVISRIEKSQLWDAVVHLRNWIQGEDKVFSLTD